MKKYIIAIIIVLAFALILSACQGGNTMKTNQADIKSDEDIKLEAPPPPIKEDADIDSIWLAGGCFWGVEEYMSRVPGVINVTSGYANGSTENPTYQDVINNSGHAETVEVTYDKNQLDLDALLDYYFRIIEPTVLNKQGNDVGSQYRTGIYYKNDDDIDIINEVVKREQKNYDEKIVTEVLKLEHYYLAEEYHQDYLQKNPNGYCHVDFGVLDEENVIKVNPAYYSKPTDAELKEKLTDAQYRVTNKMKPTGLFQMNLIIIISPGYMSMWQPESRFSHQLINMILAVDGRVL